MFTIAFITKRIAGMSLEEFTNHYQTTHYKLGSSLPGLLAYRQALIAHGCQLWSDPESYPGYDAFSTYRFASRQAADHAFASPEGLQLLDDTGTFMDWPSVLSIPVEDIKDFVAPPRG
ncbi:EthD domain-containing protein [Brevibacterium oceani]|uniref:EthD domain-containing protein n=1 Tax=Brevibacterium oceani TaxID=358099 RepID=UPI001B335CBF|nr:EthD domain-containing protein [Brevibacterium oceani]